MKNQHSTRRLISISLLLFCWPLFVLGCETDNHWNNFGETFGSTYSGDVRSTQTTIEISEFKNGRFRVQGLCGFEDEILLVLPAAVIDQRILGSPKCKNGRYKYTSSSIGRPPCNVIVEDSSPRSAAAKVKGTEIYCN